MDPPRSRSRHTQPAARRAAAAGLGALILALGSPAFPAPPASVVPPAGGPGQAARPSMDQHFIVMMIPHHDGAIAMADLALTRAKRPEIRALARSIKASQTQENAQMRTWYRAWFGGDVPTWGGAMGHGGGMGGMGMGGMGMGGMGGTDTEVALIANAPDVDRAFIEQMIPHHRMGVRMASMAQNGSRHPELLALQQAMVKVQSQEIAQMAGWYRNWYGTP
ncbi:DUF305 domain-containing protein [Cyanobium sp. N.Huapi 1H5]|uniref:DUF305 domain-containing protein n=1 Tax=Cyanobium sp. N.Huapi 1H5 TaxID=2823719 RepID=UPI0020CBE427|nr:DUF305 domain-containing protein [Cyanobium sp. N.Huapi 1H5]MCP9838634.1 DUF305 domain-containing protein [Cyanobium sp. N.Huapi 1H5]